MCKPKKEQELDTYNKKLRAEVKKRVLKIISYLQLQVSSVVFIFYCCTVHFDNIKILFTNKCTLLLNIQNVKMYL